MPDKQPTLATESNVILLDGQRVQLGALDLGSNSFHLLVAQETNGRIQVLDKHKEMVRLAAGLDDNNQLSKQACERALECLNRFAQRLRPLEPEDVRVVGTNTLRKSQSKSFLKETHFSKLYNSQPTYYVTLKILEPDKSMFKRATLFTGNFNYSLACKKRVNQA